MNQRVRLTLKQFPHEPSVVIDVLNNSITVEIRSEHKNTFLTSKLMVSLEDPITVSPLHKRSEPDGAEIPPELHYDLYGLMTKEAIMVLDTVSELIRKTTLTDLVGKGPRKVLCEITVGQYPHETSIVIDDNNNMTVEMQPGRENTYLRGKVMFSSEGPSVVSELLVSKDKLSEPESVEFLPEEQEELDRLMTNSVELLLDMVLELIKR